MAKAKNSYEKIKIQDTQDSNFGNYDEDTGGGQPMGPGSNDYPDGGRGVWKDKYKKKPKRTQQPRTKDGKFTYNSVNGHSIKQKSRGETVNPLLTGGENGIKIDEVKKQFGQQSGNYWDKYKDKWYTEGSEAVMGSSDKSRKSRNKLDLKTRVSGAAIWDIAKRSYDEVKGEFKGESHVFDEVKKGRSSKEENLAKQQAKKTGNEQFVLNQSTGGIQNRNNLNANKQTPFAPTQAPNPSAAPVIPTSSNSSAILQAPQQQTANNTASISANGMKVLNNLLNSVNKGSTAATAQKKPNISLQGFLNKQKNNNN